MMQKMPLTDYKWIIKKCFAADQDLVEKWHIMAGQGLERCVDVTFADMSGANVEFKVVYEQKDLVGYFGKECVPSGEYLTGFFVMPKYRTKEDLKEFWALIKSEFGPEFFCGLYQRNQPAIDFITRNHGAPNIVVQKNGEVGVIYKISEQVCQ